MVKSLEALKILKEEKISELAMFKDSPLTKILYDVQYANFDIIEADLKVLEGITDYVNRRIESAFSSDERKAFEEILNHIKILKGIYNNGN